MAWTKEYRAEYMKKYREQIKANRRYYYERHKGANAPSSAYHALHKDDIIYKKKNRERVKRWREKNRDKYNAYFREYRKRKALEEQG